MNEARVRSLIYVPVIHTAADMGTLAAPVAQAYRDRYGSGQWLKHGRMVQEMWVGIAERIESLRLDYRAVKVYQDGLPVCGKEEEIVRDLARRGNANHALVAHLIDRGARLVGTESPDLLLREYDLAKAQLVLGAGSVNGTWAAQQKTILEERDRFIARRIAETLAREETGILFVGILHQVHCYLTPDIEARFVIHRLPFAQRPGSTPASPGPSAGRKRRRR